MLTVIEGRVLGCLVEKERTVPDQYPLTLHGLVAACNQTTSRDPVLQLSEHEVTGAVASLKEAGIVRNVHPTHGRGVTRYRHVLGERLALEPAATAVLAVLLLRGPQTVAELRSRTERLHPFASLDEVEWCLQDLVSLGHVVQLGRQPGQKEQRWRQMLAVRGELLDRARPESDAGQADDVVEDAGHGVPAPEPVAGSMADRVARLEARVAALEAALAEQAQR